MPLPTKPATVPVWDSNLTHVGAPTAGEQTDGSAMGATPPSALWNYLFAWLTSWAAWLDSLEQQAIQWTAQHIFGAGIQVTSDGTGPAVYGVGSGVWGGAGFFGGAGNAYGVQAIGGVGGGYGGDFQRGDGLTDEPAVNAAGTINLGAGAAPASAAAGNRDRLSLTTLIKAIAFVECNGTNNPTIHFGQNIASIAQAGGAGVDGQFLVTLVTALGSTNYGVLCVCPVTSLYVGETTPGTTSVFTIRPRKSTDASYPTRAALGSTGFLIIVWGN